MKLGETLQTSAGVSPLSPSTKSETICSLVSWESESIETKLSIRVAVIIDLGSYSQGLANFIRVQPRAA